MSGVTMTFLKLSHSYPWCPTALLVICFDLQLRTVVIRTDICKNRLLGTPVILHSRFTQTPVPVSNHYGILLPTGPCDLYETCNQLCLPSRDPFRAVCKCALGFIESSSGECLAGSKLVFTLITFVSRHYVDKCCLND